MDNSHNKILAPGISGLKLGLLSVYIYISTEFDSHTAALGVICRVVQGLGETGFSVGKFTIS